MKALITGCTSQQVGGNAGLQYDTVSSLLGKMLNLGGAEVEHRKVEIDEDLSRYDLIAVGVSPANSLNTLNVYSAYNAIHNGIERGLNLFIYVDDWQFKKLRPNFAKIAEKPEQIVKPFFEFKKDYDWATQHVDQLLSVTEILAAGSWPRVIVPQFTWGDMEILRDALPWASEIFTWDPSSLARTYNTDLSVTRERAWVLGALVERDTWLRKQPFTWEVKRYGKQAKDDGTKARLKEVDLVQEYANSRGVISLPYYHAGSGWWRNRYVYAERTNSIIYCDPADTKPLDPSSSAFGWELSSIESLSDHELDELGHAQSRLMRESYQSPEELAHIGRQLLGASS